MTTRQAPAPKSEQDPAASLVARGDRAGAIALCRQRLAARADDHAAMYWQAVALAEQGQFTPAAELLRNAVAVAPADSRYWAQLGRCLAGLRQTRSACEAADTSLALQPDDAQTLDTIGVIFSFAGRHADAQTVLQQAVRRAPDNASYWFNLGASAKFNGDFAAAEHAYEQAVAHDPAADKALAALAHLRRQPADSPVIPRLRDRLRCFQGSLQDEMRVTFALAKALDDAGECAESFALLTAISRRWRASINYRLRDDAQMFSALQTGFDTAALGGAGPGHTSDEPIFIVGMPRTGTTLTERIIASHSEVFAAGELNHFGRLVRLAAQARANPDFDPDRVRQVLHGDLQRLGRDYVAATRPATGHTPRFIDKMPLNFLYAGFIAQALPNARIICVRRNPMDTCLSNFRQLFSLRSAYYAYSYDLLDCGRYYLMFDQLMRHWDQLFPGRILTLHYEALVADQEGESRKLLDFCGLDWEAQCLDFHTNRAPVATASSAQVREPIYRSAVARWKRYEAELQPLAELFSQQGISWET
ncbi:MAG: sulfotransferase [Gammaproteobacteria bacterium]|jgi:tetratricopeptide (TPR) repeat protein|nr:sulfotransferase [Gammaproteobacteria bacterium]